MCLLLQNDLENGNGTFVWTDGYKFTGAWVDGRKTGYGEYFYKNGDTYKGNVSVPTYLRFLQLIFHFSFKLASSMALERTPGPMEPSMLEIMIKTRELALEQWFILMGQSSLAFGKMEFTKSLGRKGSFSINSYALL